MLARVAGRELGRVPLAAACAIASLAFGAVMNLHLWVTYSGDHTLAKLGANFATSLPFDLAHAVGSVLFCLAFGPALVRALARYRTRFEVRWVPARRRPRPSCSSCARGRAAVARAARGRRRGRERSVRYLRGAQNDDGGWGGRRPALVAALHGLGGARARRRRPQPARRRLAERGRLHPRATRGELNDLGELNRTILVLAPPGCEPRARRPRPRARAARTPAARRLVRRPREHDRVRDPRRCARPGGRASDRAVRRAADWIARPGQRRRRLQLRRPRRPVGDRRHRRRAPGARRRRPAPQRPAVQRAARFLVRNQASDGGFALIPGGASNAQSTAWAVQGLLAAGRDPAKVRRNGSRDPLSYLRSLTAADGEVRYSRTSRQTPGVGHRPGGGRAGAQDAAARAGAARAPRGAAAAAATAAPPAPTATAPPPSRATADEAQPLPPVATAPPRRPSRGAARRAGRRRARGSPAARARSYAAPDRDAARRRSRIRLRRR